MPSFLAFSSTTELVRLPADALAFVEADGNYSVLSTADGSRYTLGLQLGQVERHIAATVADGDNRFIRIGKSLIINRDFITFINPARQRLILSDCRTFRREVSASRDALRALKDFIEQQTVI